MDECNSFRPAAAIFDMDGLMLDTEGPMARMWVEAGKLFSLEIKIETALRTIGIDDAKSRVVFLEEHGGDFPYDTVRNEWRRLVSRELESGIAHKKGLVPLLDHLSSLGIPLAVATTTPRKSALERLGKAGVLGRFSALACGDEIARGKPAPDIFLLAAERLGKEPSGCVGFEDSPAGLRGLHAAGIRSVFVKDLVEPEGEVLSTVWRRCGDLAEAIALFR
jgi:HAD superfamily hydrolase (TIGR01509 family)